MVRRPDDMHAFEFVVVSALRAAQRQRGCSSGQSEQPIGARAHESSGQHSRVPLLAYNPASWLIDSSAPTVTPPARP
jgi:hypothetical protein